MKITLKNKELQPAITFLDSMVLTANSDSRHRSKLIKLLSQAVEELQQEEQSLLSAQFLLDESGQLLPEHERDFEKVAEFNTEHAGLLEEEVVIDSGMFAKNISEIPRILYEYAEPLSGEEAVIYDRLLDEFEKNEETEATE